jgi:hypothetical protein
MKLTLLITLILPKKQLSPREQSAMPPHFRHGRKRLRVTVEADNEDEAIEIAKKAVLKRYPDGKIDTVKVSKP